MKKRFVSLLVVVCMLLTLFPVSAFADNAKSGEFHTDGIKTQDGNFVYSVNEDDTATLVQYIGSEDVLAANNYEVDIPAEFDGHSLSRIGQAAFAAEYHSNFKYWNATCGKIQKVKIPESVTYICAGAFYHCESLKSVNIPENVTKIEWWGFANCTGLDDITFEGNSKITTIEMECFSNCSSLERIDLPEGITDIRWGAFENCTSLMNVVIPSNTERIYRKAFYNCALGTVTFPASLKGIEVAAFGRPISLTKVYYAGTADQWNALVSAPFVPLDGKTDGTSKNFTGINYKEDSYGGNNEQLRQDGLVIIPCKMDVTTSKSDYLVNTPVDVNIAIAPGTDMSKILNGSVALTYGDEVEKVELNGKELTKKEYIVRELAQKLTSQSSNSQSSNIKATLNVTYKKAGKFDFGVALKDASGDQICAAGTQVVVAEEAAELTPATKLYTLTVKNADVTIKNGDEEIKAEKNDKGELIAKVPEKADVTVTYTSQSDAVAFDQWTITTDETLDVDVKNNPLKFQMPAGGVTIEAMTKDASIEEDEPNILGTAAVVGTAAAGTAILAWQGYQLGTELYLKTALPAGTAIPTNRAELALLVWNHAGKPAPAAVLPADATDTQKAIAWAVENDLLKAAKDNGETYVETDSVSRVEVIRVWNKAQEK